MRMVATHRAVIAAVAVAGLAVAAAEVQLDATRTDGEERLIQRVVTQSTRSGIAIKALRELRAGTVNGKHQGWMTVQTTLSPEGAFAWDVLEEGGSTRTREKVFRSLLRTEAEAWSAESHRRAALTPANYEFVPLERTASGQVTFRVIPRREDSALIDGTLTVSADGYPLRLEGKMAKSPSFWVKSVTVVKRYGRFAGIALPTTIESLAELKLFGRSSFTMRYRYLEVDGHSVSHALTQAPLRGPSPEILALHASGVRQ